MYPSTSSSDPASPSPARLAPELLTPILWVAFVGVVVWLATAAATPSMRTTIGYPIAAGVVVAACLVLARTGRTHASAVTFCVVVWGFVQLPPFVNGSLGVPGILLPPVLTLAAGLLWSTRAAILIAVSTSAVWLGAMVGISRGWVSSELPPRPDFHFWLLLTECLLVVSVGLVLTRTALWRALAHPTDRTPIHDSAPEPPPASEPPSEADDPRPPRPEAGPNLEELEWVGQLAGGIAHDFNNLLTVVGTATERIEDDPDATDSILALAGRIRAAQERAEVVTKRLLAFAQRQVVHTRRLSAGPAVKTQIQFMRPFLDRSITLDLSLTSDDTSVHSSDSEIEQILLNLVNNASDAIGGIGPISIRVERRHLDQPLDGPAGAIPRGEYVVLSVGDEGPGIPPDVLGRVFEPFYSTKSGDAARGLGLPAVLGIARRSGGQVAIESEPGRGTLVEVLLPLAGPERSVVH